jgi:transcription elongation factor Elf1
MKGDAPATIACGSCGLTYTLERKPGEEAIDLYNRFVDLYMTGQVGG